MRRPSRDLETLFTDGSVSGMSDSAFLERFATDRDDEAFEALVVRHGPMVWGVCRRILRDPNDAEDAFQATFLVLARKASSIARRELVANWLYAVAYKSAVRFRATASKRRTREKQIAEMPEPAAATDNRQDELLALLDQELRRLPGKYRVPVLLCELEGKTHREAANELGCPVGTISSRLSRGRAILAQRLARHRVSLPAGALAVLVAGDAAAAPMPSRLVSATARAAPGFAAGGASGVVAAEVADLARQVLKAALLSRLKAASLLFLALAGAGFLWFGSGTSGARQPARPAAPQPAAIAPPPHLWAHLTSDAGFESWVRLKDAWHLWKDDRITTLDDPAKGTELKYWGNGPILMRPKVFPVKEDGSPDVEGALGNARVGRLDQDSMRRLLTEVGRRFEDAKFAREVHAVDLDGRRAVRTDIFQPDSLGRWRLQNQSWYDIETRLPVRYRQLLSADGQLRYEREYRTTIVAYVDTPGPADIYALGVPAGTPIVVTPDGPPVIAALPPAYREALNGAARALERFPRSVRVVEHIDNQLNLTYWSAPKGYLATVAANVRNIGGPTTMEGEAPRSFSADNQGSHDLPQIPPRLLTRPEDDLPADALAAWLPIDQSANININDGKHLYHLLRTYTARDKPRKVQLFVNRAGAGDPPDWLQTIWPFAFEIPSNLELVPPAPGAPKGSVAMKFAHPTVEFRYEADPAHGYAVARKVESSTEDGGRLKFRTESRALRWAQLPGGTWYVTAWEELRHIEEFDAAGKLKPERSGDDTVVRRVVITPMDPDKFPPGIFDGDKFLDTARKAGATILVD